MHDKILSISVAAYNMERYLDTTLKSLVCSDDIMEQVEVLVIDDGSTDRTADIAQKYVEDFPNTFRLIRKQNGGHGSTLVCSMEKAQGKYFKMLDGDDWFDTGNFQRLVVALKSVNADIVLSPYHNVYEDDGRLEEVDRHRLPNGKSYDICELNSTLIEHIQAAEMTVRTDVLRKRPFLLTEHCVYTDSEYVFVAMLYAETYMRLPWSVYQYRIGRDEQTTSAAGRKKHWRDAGRVVSAMICRYMEYGEKDICDFQRENLSEYLFATASYQYANYFLAENVLEAEKDFDLFNRTIQQNDKNLFETIQRNCVYYQRLHSLFKTAHEIGDRDCVVFGAGRYGQVAAKIFCGRGVYVTAFADNNSALWEKKVSGINVINPDDLTKTYSKTFVYVAVIKHQDDICRQLANMGIDSSHIITPG